jgi:hypothetical protein
MATTLYFSINISRAESMRYYRGEVRSVSVVAHNGQRIQFPVENIRPFITQSGVQGSFAISFDNNHKLIGITRI